MIRALTLLGLVVGCHGASTDSRSAAPTIGNTGGRQADVATNTRSHRLIKSGDPDVVAEWSSDAAQISIDGGHSFRRVVNAPKEVRDVTFDEYDRMVVLVASLPDGTERVLGEVDLGTGSMTYVVTTKPN